MFREISPKIIFAKRRARFSDKPAYYGIDHFKMNDRSRLFDLAYSAGGRGYKIDIDVLIKALV